MPPLFGRQRTEWLLRVSWFSLAGPLPGLPRLLLEHPMRRVICGYTRSFCLLRSGCILNVFSLECKGIFYLKKSQTASLLCKTFIY